MSKEPPLLHLRALGDCPVALWGLSSAERLSRQVRGAGVALAVVGSPPRAGDTVLLARADYVYDLRIIRNLLATSNVLLRTSEADGSAAVAAHVDPVFAADAERLLSGEPDAGRLSLRQTTVGILADPYIAELLKAEAPLLLPIRAEQRAQIEQRLFDGSYKGVTDVVTKYIWPMPAKWMTRLCVAAGIRPNHVTSTSIVLACVVTALFALGWLGTGLVVAWFMTFLDTVDGKLARVTVDTSDLGHFMDKILDIVHPPIWYTAWGFGLWATAVQLAPGDLSRLAITIVAGFTGGRLAEVLFRRIVGGFSIFSWRRFDSRFRMVMARRNPCLLLLTASLLLGRPDQGLVAVAVWMVLSGVILIVRVLQATYERMTVGPLHAWLRVGGGDDAA